MYTWCPPSACALPRMRASALGSSCICPATVVPSRSGVPSISSLNCVAGGVSSFAAAPPRASSCAVSSSCSSPVAMVRFAKCWHASSLRSCVSVACLSPCINMLTSNLVVISSCIFASPRMLSVKSDSLIVMARGMSVPLVVSMISSRCTATIANAPSSGI